MWDWLAQAAHAYLERDALVYGPTALTYRDLDALVDRAAAWLEAHGVSPIQRVGVYLPSSVDAVATIHALIRLGAVLVPLNRRLSISELSEQVDYCDFVVSDVELSFQNVLRVSDYAKFRPLPEAERTPLDLDATHALIFTSGTSGKPKPAELTYENQFYSAAASALRSGVQPDDRWLCCLPLYHVGGLAIILRSALYGTCVVLQDGFDVEAVNRALDVEGVTLLSLVPTMLYRLLESRTTPPPHLRLTLLGGAAASPELVGRANEAGFKVATTYGLTEAASQVATSTPEITARKPASAGKAVPFTQIRVVDDIGHPLTATMVGEVVVRGPTVMRGYYEHPEATAKALRDGWLHTGDMGYLDDDGDLWLVQRRSDLIVSGGENVYPAEVENALREHLGVRDACVVGLAHPEWGQQVAAMVVRSDDALTGDALSLFLRRRLAGYKIPRVIRFVDALPLTASGKVARNEVQRMMEEEVQEL